MASHFHALKVKEVRKESPDCVSLAFEVPAPAQQDFAFTQGQYLTLKANIQGTELRRSYSICSAPSEKELRVAIKRVDGGVFSTWANTTIQAGDTLEVMPPQGKFFTPLQPDASKSYVAFAAGSGITPIISIIKETLAKESNSTFTLVYSNRSRSSIIFFEALEALKNIYLQRFNLILLLSREKMDTPLHFGRINQEKLAQLASIIAYHKTDVFYICGPEELIVNVSDFLKQTGIDAKKIHFELFGTPGQYKKASAEKSKSAADEGPKSHVTVKLDGRSFEFDLAFDSESILDAASRMGADVPYSCKGGVCCTCRAKLVEGEVDMVVNYVLDPEEVAHGYILTCQSHPRTEKVVVDFDER